MERAALYRDIVEGSPDAIWVCDLQGRTLYANPAMCRLYGAADAEEMSTVTVFDTLDETGRGQFAQHLETLEREGANADDVDVLFWRKDGTSLWVILSEREIHDEAGNRIGFVHRISDNSERRQTLEDLTESRQQLAEATRIARLGSWSWDLHTNAVTATAELANLYGIDPADYPATYEGFLETLHPDDRAMVDAMVRRALETRGEFHFDARVRGANGWVWTRSRGLAATDESGQVVGMTGTHQDITETKLAELALEDQVRQNALMEAVAIAANEAHTLADVLAQGQQMVLLHDDWERARAFVPDPTETAVVPFYVTEADGREDAITRDVTAKELMLANRAYLSRATQWDEERLTIAVPISYGDTVYAVMTITFAPPLHRHAMIQSMAEQVAVQIARVAEREHHERELAAARDAAMEASRQKSEFLATMSHEIRTPLNGVIGLNDLLMRTRLEPDQLRLASGVQVAGRTLLAIINDILDFSKIEAGMLELERLDFQVRSVFDQVASMLAESAREKGLELIVACHPDVPDMVAGDPTRLAQVLTNLGANAVKFTESGEVFIRATTIPGDGGTGTMLHVTVADTGIGVDPAVADSLFEAFTQADASTTRHYGGTGLGLAICREIVTALGGDIGVLPNPGGGSIFWFTAQFAEPAGAASDPVDEQAREALAGRRVLIVDDNGNNRLILEEQLAGWQIRTASVPDAAAAEQALAAAVAEGDPFEGAVLDLNMPGRDGLDLARGLSRAPAYADLTLLLLTSSITPTPAELAEAGVAGCLRKPALSVELRAELLHHLAGIEPLAHEAAAPADQAGPRRRVLVVEDNPLNQIVAVGFLESLGYEAATADDGQDALATLEIEEFDAVLMDVQMPRLDGYAATRAIRAESLGMRDGRPLPVIAMTAAAVEGERERCLAAGMDDFLTKPVDPTALAAVLERWIFGASPAPRRTLQPMPDAPQQPQPAILDLLARDRLDELRDLDPGNTAYLDRAIGNFVANTPETFERVLAAYEAGDAETLKQVVHKLAGGALNLGVTAAGATAQQIELIADGGATEGAGELVATLERQLAEGREALLAYQALYSSQRA